MNEGFIWHHSPSEVFPDGLDDYTHAIRWAVVEIAQRRAPEIEAWMKANAPWTDRTGNARQTLHTEVQMVVDTVVITLAHGMSYGRFLELAHGGQYAVIGPALDEFAPKLWDDIKQLLR